MLSCSDSYLKVMSSLKGAAGRRCRAQRWPAEWVVPWRAIAPFGGGERRLPRCTGCSTVERPSRQEPACVDARACRGGALRPFRSGAPPARVLRRRLCLPLHRRLAVVVALDDQRRRLGRALSSMMSHWLRQQQSRRGAARQGQQGQQQRQTTRRLSSRRAARCRRTGPRAWAPAARSPAPPRDPARPPTPPPPRTVERRAALALAAVGLERRRELRALVVHRRAPPCRRGSRRPLIWRLADDCTRRCTARAATPSDVPRHVVAHLLPPRLRRVTVSPVLGRRKDVALSRRRWRRRRRRTRPSDLLAHRASAAAIVRDAGIATRAHVRRRRRHARERCLREDLPAQDHARVLRRSVAPYAKTAQFAARAVRSVARIARRNCALNTRAAAAEKCQAASSCIFHRVARPFDDEDRRAAAQRRLEPMPRRSAPLAAHAANVRGSLHTWSTSGRRHGHDGCSQRATTRRRPAARRPSASTAGRRRRKHAATRRSATGWPSSDGAAARPPPPPTADAPEARPARQLPRRRRLRGQWAAEQPPARARRRRASGNRLPPRRRRRAPPRPRRRRARRRGAEIALAHSRLSQHPRPAAVVGLALAANLISADNSYRSTDAADAAARRRRRRRRAERARALLDVAASHHQRPRARRRRRRPRVPGSWRAHGGERAGALKVAAQRHTAHWRRWASLVGEEGRARRSEDEGRREGEEGKRAAGRRQPRGTWSRRRAPPSWRRACPDTVSADLPPPCEEAASKEEEGEGGEVPDQCGGARRRRGRGRGGARGSAHAGGGVGERPPPRVERLEGVLGYVGPF